MFHSSLIDFSYDNSEISRIRNFELFEIVRIILASNEIFKEIAQTRGNIVVSIILEKAFEFSEVIWTI